MKLKKEKGKMGGSGSLGEGFILLTVDFLR